MKGIYITTILFLLCLANIGFSQTVGSLAGTIKNEKGDPIRGATVRILGTSPLRGAVTKENGEFLVAGIRAGLYGIQITSVGYKPYVKENVRISVDMTTTINILLASAPPHVDTILVYSRADPASGNPERMQQSARTNIQGAAALGSTNANVAGDVVMRGGRASETSIRVDGISVSDPFMGAFGGNYGEAPVGIVQAEAETFNHGGHAEIIENKFHEARSERFSTFGIDVDAASYTIMRRYLSMGHLPPADAVRIEEMINYFSYDYPDPSGDAPFSINTEVASCPWNPDHRLVHIGLQGKRINTADLPPSNLVFLIDVSGSMSSQDRLPLLKKSLALLVDQLRPQDQVAIVVYAGAAGVVLESTSGTGKEKILKSLERLSSGGSTAGSAGILLAYETAARNFLKDGNNRVILATDGDFNVGISDIKELEKLIVQKRGEGIFLTVLGVGTDNYQDALMETLADKGNGNYAYIDRLEEGERVLVQEMGGTLVTIAKDVKIQVEFNPEIVSSYRLIGYENRLLERKDFHDDSKDAGELGAGHSVTALYEVTLVSMDADPQPPESPRTSPEADERPSLSHLNGGRILLRPASHGKQDTLLYVKLRYKEPQDSTSKLLIGPVLDATSDIASASDNFRFSAAVAQFGMLLRSSGHKGNGSYENVIDLATAARGIDAGGSRAEFISLAESCRDLAGSAEK